MTPRRVGARAARQMLALGCTLALVTTADRAYAAAPTTRTTPPAGIALARRLFHQATVLEQQKNWDKAAEKLQKAIAVKDTPGLRYHLATCEEHTGRLMQALVDYDRAQAMLDDGAKAPDVARLLGPTRDAIKKRVPTLTVDIPPDVAGVTLELDGKPVASALLDQPAPLDPGRHEVRVTAPGHGAFVQSVTLKEGEARVVHAKLAVLPLQSAHAPVAPTRPPAPAGTSHHAFPTRTVVLITEAAVTVAGLGVGIGYTLARSSANSRANDARKRVDQIPGGTNSNPCFKPQPSVRDACDALANGLSDGHRDGNIATVGFVTAGVGAVATVATWFLWGPEAKKEALDVGVTPLAGGGAYWSARGTF